MGWFESQITCGTVWGVGRSFGSAVLFPQNVRKPSRTRPWQVAMVDFYRRVIACCAFYPQQQGFASLKVSKWRANHMDLSNMSMCPQDIGLKPMVSPLVGDIISIHFHFQVWVVMVYHYVQPSLIHQLQFPLRISYAVSAIRSHSVWISRKTP